MKIPLITVRPIVQYLRVPLLLTLSMILGWLTAEWLVVVCLGLFSD